MKALIKISDPTDIIAEPFPDWLDPVAFSVFDCYAYAFCSEYDPEKETEIVFSVSCAAEDLPSSLQHFAK